MNPHDELKALVELFPGTAPLFLAAEHIPSASTPEPYKAMLVHDHHMTLAMEQFHRCAVEVRVLHSRHEGEFYCREILLLKQGTDQVVQYGLVRFQLKYVTAEVSAEIVAEKVPLGRILINHNVLRQIDLGAILKISAGPRLANHFRMPTGDITYGRLATIFCNGRPAVDLLEVSAPLV